MLRCCLSAAGWLVSAPLLAIPTATAPPSPHAAAARSSAAASADASASRSSTLPRWGAPAGAAPAACVGMGEQAGGGVKTQHGSTECGWLPSQLLPCSANCRITAQPAPALRPRLRPPPGSAPAPLLRLAKRGKRWLRSRLALLLLAVRLAAAAGAAAAALLCTASRGGKSSCEGRRVPACSCHASRHMQQGICIAEVGTSSQAHSQPSPANPQARSHRTASCGGPGAAAARPAAT